MATINALKLYLCIYVIVHKVSLFWTTVIKFKEWLLNVTYLFRSPKEKHANLLSNPSKLKNLPFPDAQALRVTNPLSVGYAWIKDAVSLTSLKWLPFSLIAQTKGHLNGRCCGLHLVYVRETAEIQEIYFLRSRSYKTKHMGKKLRSIMSLHQNLKWF